MILADIPLCDIYKPSIIVSMRDVPDDFAWYSWFRKNDMQGITYSFCYKNTVLKYGCSYARFNTRSKENTSYGERLIRQMKNLPGRAKINPSDDYLPGYGFVPKSENGSDIRKVIKDYQKEINKSISRDDIYVHIWDITNIHSTHYYFAPDDQGNKKRAEYFEGLMVDQYKLDNNGKPPIGNIQDPSLHNHAYTKPQISMEASKLFQFT